MSPLRHSAKARRGLLILAFFAQLLTVSALIPGTAAAIGAGGNHVFDPTLSLIGGPGTSKLDPVPDPGEVHPPQPFKFDGGGVAVDSDGDVYVASPGELSEEEGWVNGRIDVFDPAGNFITEIGNEEGPGELAVDSVGNIYVVQHDLTDRGTVRYAPSAYPPAPGVVYSGPAMAVPAPNAEPSGLAVNRRTDHLFLDEQGRLSEYGTAAEGNPLVAEDIDGSTLSPVGNGGIAVDSATGSIFAASICKECYPIPNAENPFVKRVFIFDEAGNLTGELDGSDLPTGGFVGAFGQMDPGVDEATGELLVDNVRGDGHVYRFLPLGGAEYEYAPDPELESHSYQDPSALAVANGSRSPTMRNVYVTSNNSTSHLFAFVPPPETGPPIVSEFRVSNVATDEAGFSAELDPNGLPTRYRFEYVSQEQYTEDTEALGLGHGFDHASATPDFSLAPGQQPVKVTAAVEDLSPGTEYRVRLVAENCTSPGEAEASCVTEGAVTAFATYPEVPVLAPCSNDALRTGLSALLPDCRAYELVTPADTNGREPTGSGIAFGAGSFDTELISPDGESVLFSTIGGGLPGSDGNGIIERYEARRSDSGWAAENAGFSGAQSQSPSAGGASPDHGYWFMSTGGGQDHGSMVIEGRETHYLRLPDQSFSLLGDGPLGTDYRAEGRWISSDGSHIIFTSATPLVAGASPEGVATVYDRTASGIVRVLSLKPDDVAPQAGAEVEYRGASADGSTVAFSVTEGATTTLYEHIEGGPTVAVTEGNIAFAGLSANGSRLTYVKGGDIFSFDAATRTTSAIGSGGSSTVVNVSGNGLFVYFVSPIVLGEETGAAGGEDNFYAWNAESGAVRFIGVLAPVDLTGAEGAYALGSWTAENGQWPATDPSRTSADGRVIVFESHANLSPYVAHGHSEIYRYEVGGQGVICVSCTPTLAPPDGDAHLQILPSGSSLFAQQAPLLRGTSTSSLTSDGGTVFFQTPEPLVPRDLDGVDDVYEWEAGGKGGCTATAGCLSLISSGHSEGPNYLYAATRSGSDVLFTTPDVLTAADGDVTRSIYDARVAGGFPEEAARACVGEGCRLETAPVPTPAGPLSQVSDRRACRRGFRKIARKGNVRCRRRSQRRHRHHRGRKPRGAANQGRRR